MAGRFTIETIFKGIDRMTAPISRIQSRVKSMTDGVTRNVKAMDQQLSKVAGTMKTIGTGIAAGGAVAGAGLIYAGRAGADFEEAISRVGAVSLLSRDQIADLEKKALELGATTKFTATEAANAMEVMGRAGFTNGEILQGIGGILSAAAAEGADMAEVTSHVSNVLKGMGLEASETGRVADVLALASARTNSSISSLGESMKNLSPVARQFGVGLEEAVSMVALLQDVGLDASEAGTATATMLTKLAKPSDEVAKQMKEMGISFKDAAGNALPMSEIFQQMLSASGQLGGNMDKVAFFADLVGLRGQKAALNLQDLFTSDKGQKLVEELKKAEGSAAKMASLSMENLKGDLTLLESAADGVKVALFNTESVGLRAVVKGTTDWIGKNQELIVSGFVGFMTDLRDSLPAIVTWLGRIGKILTVFALFALAVKGVSVALAVLNALAAVNPFVLWTYALVAAIALVWAFWPEISDFFGRVWGIVKSVGRWIRDLFVGLAEFLVGIVVIMAQPWIDLAKWVIGALSPLWGFFGWLWDGIAGMATAAFQGIVDFVTWVVGAVREIWEPIGAWFSELWDSIASGFMSSLGWVIDKIGSVVSTIRGIGSEALGTDASGTAAGAMVSPAERTARSISESNTTTTQKSEVTIKPAAGASAEVTKGRRNGTLRLQPTGAF